MADTDTGESKSQFSMTEENEKSSSPHQLCKQGKTLQIPIKETHQGSRLDEDSISQDGHLECSLVSQPVPNLHSPMIQGDIKSPLQPPSGEICKPQIVEEEPDSHDEIFEYSSGSDRSFEGDEEFDSEGAQSKPRSKKNLLGNQRHGSQGHGSRRQKGGNRHKKTFQPYPQQEKHLKRKSQERKEKETAAAETRNEAGRAFYKFPVAPFNSNEFLMEEHHDSISSHSFSPKPHCGRNPKTPNESNLHSFNSLQMPSSLLNNSSNETDMFDKSEKDFAADYSSIHAESLQSLSKDELVKHYMGLEEKIALLQKQVKQVKPDMDEKDSASGSDTNSLSSSNEEFVDISNMSQTSVQN